MKNRKIVLITDYSFGIQDAGRFAINHLMDKDSTLIMLQTYQASSFGNATLRNLSIILRNVAEREINSHKKSISKELNGNAVRIETMVIEGELRSILNSQFNNSSPVSVVLGFPSEEEKLHTSYENIFNELIKSKVRPVFLVSDKINLLLEESRIHFTLMDDNKPPEKIRKFLRSASHKFNLDLEESAGGILKRNKIEENTLNHLTRIKDQETHKNEIRLTQLP